MNEEKLRCTPEASASDGGFNGQAQAMVKAAAEADTRPLPAAPL